MGVGSVVGSFRDEVDANILSVRGSLLVRGSTWPAGSLDAPSCVVRRPLRDVSEQIRTDRTGLSAGNESGWSGQASGTSWGCD